MQQPILRSQDSTFLTRSCVKQPTNEPTISVATSPKARQIDSWTTVDMMSKTKSQQTGSFSLSSFDCAPTGALSLLSTLPIDQKATTAAAAAGNVANQRHCELRGGYIRSGGAISPTVIAQFDHARSTEGPTQPV